MKLSGTRPPGIEVPDRPHFDAESYSYFRERLAGAAEYLEYGSGGSTVEAARLNKRFTTVDSDELFLKAVQQKIGACYGSFIYANIGSTGEWGKPKIKRWTPWRRRRWSNYVHAPWRNGIKPDLILIDGRFRVHCALYTISMLRGADFEILFDDYANRPFYRDVERFADLHDLKGRMAVFKPKSFDLSEINRAMKRYAVDSN